MQCTLLQVTMEWVSKLPFKLFRPDCNSLKISDIQFKIGKVILEKKGDDLVVRFVAYLLSCSFFWVFFSPITCPETLIKQVSLNAKLGNFVCNFTLAEFVHQLRHNMPYMLYAMRSMTMSRPMVEHRQPGAKQPSRCSAIEE